MRNGSRYIMALCLAGALGAQTAIDLRRQSKNVDFSAASSTKPNKTGLTLPADCVVGETFFKRDAPAGLNLYGCTDVNVWTLLNTPASTQLFQMGDMRVERSSATVLTVNATCSPATPCNSRIGPAVFTFTQPSTITLVGAGTASTVYVYLSASGVLTAGHLGVATLTCSSCAVVSGVTGFPQDGIPLFTWGAGATANQWDAAGTDWRALLAITNVTAGAGLIRSTNTLSGTTKLELDPSAVPMRTAPPESAASVCTPGQWALDAEYTYYCVAPDSWRRAAISSW